MQKVLKFRRDLSKNGVLLNNERVKVKQSEFHRVDVAFWRSEFLVKDNGQGIFSINYYETLSK